MQHAPFFASLRLWAVGGLLVPFGLPALGSCQVLGLLPHGCTEMGCQDGVELTLRTADGTWPPGAYALTLVVEGTSQSCALMLPGDLPTNGGSTQLACTPNQGSQGAALNSEVTCVEQRSADSVSQSCTPVPGHFTLSAHVAGAPPALDVILTRDGVQLLAQSLAPTYVRTTPNGEDCDPVCQQASVELGLP